MIELPLLYTRNSDGSLSSWLIWTEGDVVNIETGKIDGKKVHHRTVAKPTNVGRSNERPGPEQALFEAKAKHKKQLETGYFLTEAAARETRVMLPMLAQKYAPKGMQFPVGVQRKLNGFRCLASKALASVTLTSRKGKAYDVAHLAHEIGQVLPDGHTLDGEIYVHGVPFDTLSCWIKNPALPERLALEYHVYDYPVLSGGFEIAQQHRLDQLKDIFGQTAGIRTKVVGVETFIAHSDEEVRQLERQFVAEGYEGAIIRGLDSPYAFGLQRPKWLQKLKTFKDAEFTVLDATSLIYDVNGRREEIIDCFIVQNDINSSTFETKPKGDVDRKRHYWVNRDKYIGRKLTVRFHDRSSYGLPVPNPVGVGFRDEATDLPDEED